MSPTRRSWRRSRRPSASTAFGMFGAPTIVVDGEVFWGNDRLPQIERWLSTGPF
jgi:2-hydroxychromene-2-carboxylate isomerase